MARLAIELVIEKADGTSIDLSDVIEAKEGATYEEDVNRLKERVEKKMKAIDPDLSLYVDIVTGHSAYVVVLHRQTEIADGDIFPL